MANTLGLNITAADHATRVIQRLNKNVNQMTRPFQNVQRSLRAFARAAGFDTVKKKLESLTHTARGIVSAFARIGAPLLALVGGGTIAGLLALTDGWARFGLQLSQTSQILGINTQDLYNFQNAARLVGISGVAATQALSSFADTLQDARWGRNQQAMGLLIGLGIHLKSTKAGAIDSIDVLGQVADKIQAFQKEGNTGGARTLARQLGVTELLPFLMGGRKAMEAYEAQSQKLAGSMDWNLARDAGLQWQRMDVAMTGAKNTIAAALLPAITPLVSQFGAWISANKGLIATDLSSFLKGLGAAFKGISLKGVLDDILAIIRGMLSLGRGIAQVTSHFGGVKTVLEVLAGFWVASKVLKFGMAFAKMASWINGARKALIAYRAASTVGAAAAAGEDAAIGAGGATGLAGGGMLAAAGGLGIAAGAGIGLGWGIDKLFPNNWAAQFGNFIGGELADSGDNFARTHQAQNVMRFFQRQGWTRDQAAGITAGIQAESNFNPRAIGDHGAARGIGQWHAARQAQFNAWATQNKLPDLEHADLLEQLQYKNYELHRSDAGKRLLGARSAAEAGAIDSLYDERPAGGQTEAARRGMIAAQIAGERLAPINVSVQTNVQRDGTTTTRVQTPAGVKIVHTNPADSVS